MGSENRVGQKYKAKDNRTSASKNASKSVNFHKGVNEKKVENRAYVLPQKATESLSE